MTFAASKRSVVKPQRGAGPAPVNDMLALMPIAVGIGLAGGGICRFGVR
jgi:hypothetical protein